MKCAFLTFLPPNNDEAFSLNIVILGQNNDNEAFSLNLLIFNIDLLCIRQNQIEKLRIFLIDRQKIFCKI